MKLSAGAINTLFSVSLAFLNPNLPEILDTVSRSGMLKCWTCFGFSRSRLMSDVTRILSKIAAGDPQASEELLPLVYEELRRLASAKLANEKPGQTLQATALVHEAYLRMVDVDRDQPWDGRAHFFGAAAESMRRIMIDNARRKKSQRAGGGMVRRELQPNEPAVPRPDDDLLALDEALKRLASKDPRKAKLVELRCFAGLTNEKAAACLGISTATAERDWAYARAWLHRCMSDAD